MMCNLVESLRICSEIDQPRCHIIFQQPEFFNFISGYHDRDGTSYICRIDISDKQNQQLPQTIPLAIEKSPRL